MPNRFYNFQFYLIIIFPNMEEYRNILSAEFDVNEGSSIQYTRQFLRKTNISYPLTPTGPCAYQWVINTYFSEKNIC